jgi:hypothetical protein
MFARGVDCVSPSPFSSIRFGETVKPVSYDIGNYAWETPYKPPSHGGKSEVKNFFDKSHLNVNSY